MLSPVVGKSLIIIVLSLSPAIRISPLSALSMPPSIFRRVDFPEPDGPRSTQNSPFATVKSMPFNTSCLVSPVPKLLVNPLTFKNFLSALLINSSPFIISYRASLKNRFEKDRLCMTYAVLKLTRRSSALLRSFLCLCLLFVALTKQVFRDAL